MEPDAKTNDAVSFGPFRLVARERLLTKQGVPVELGGRTLDTLIALVSRPNEWISKKDLLSQVWPDVTVEEANLRFHIFKLRKALGDGKNGARYIVTLPGRGYCFIAPLSRLSNRSEKPFSPQTASFPRPNLPSRLLRLVGRDDDVVGISTKLVAARFVTIVGAGGVGKTTVAVAVGHDLIDALVGAVLFIDLAALNDPKQVAASLAAIMGLTIQSDDPTPNIISYLRDRRFLLILDNCEHLVDASASLASAIFAASPQAHILITSREALRVEGEYIYRLEPLGCPPDNPDITAAVAQTFPATRLFLERAIAGGARFDLNDANVSIVVSICRKLDGVPLAIELGAGRVANYGLEQTATLLDQRLNLLWQGQRTAPPRQQTLRATLEWSYGLLSEPERIVLRRLGVFVGYFTIDAALAVVTNPTVSQALVFSAIESLIAKSMVTTHPVGPTVHYRLLDTTRAYILEMSDHAECTDLAGRHAMYYTQWLEQIGSEGRALFETAPRMPLLATLNNVRAALEWSFGIDGDVRIGVALATAVAPFFLAMSLLTDCHRWSERAILALDDSVRGGRDEMHLQAAFGVSLIFIRGNTEEAQDALNKGLAIAEQCGDTVTQVQLLNRLHLFHIRVGDFNTALRLAKSGVTISKGITKPTAAAVLAHSMLGISLQFAGELKDARAELEAALRFWSERKWISAVDFYFDQDNRIEIMLARTLWLLGHPAQAVKLARQSVKDAVPRDHPLMLSYALLSAIHLFLWTGDLDSAEEHVDWLISHCEHHSLSPHATAGHGYRGELAIRRGDAVAGVENLRNCLEAFQTMNYRSLATPLSIALSQGLGAIGRSSEGIALIGETIRHVETNGNLSTLPEALRVKGKLLLLKPQPMRDDAELCLKQSLELGRRQGSRAWELRTATDLAKLWAADGHILRAQSVLQSVLERFTEGFDTADVRAAQQLRIDLGHADRTRG
jgi:predicted ATPase/DNA-binding winged helix-turn-helix (wHTH) protein